MRKQICPLTSVKWDRLALRRNFQSVFFTVSLYREKARQREEKRQRHGWADRGKGRPRGEAQSGVEGARPRSHMGAGWAVTRVTSGREEGAPRSCPDPQRCIKSHTHGVSSALALRATAPDPHASSLPQPPRLDSAVCGWPQVDITTFLRRDILFALERCASLNMYC